MGIGLCRVPHRHVDADHQGGSPPRTRRPDVNHDNNQHAADENQRLQNHWDGIETYASLMALLHW